MPTLTQATVDSIATKTTLSQVNSSAQLDSTTQVTGLDADLSTINGDISTINTDLLGKLDKSGGTMTGNLILNADATIPLQAVTLQQLSSFFPTLNIVYLSSDKNITQADNDTVFLCENSLHITFQSLSSYTADFNVTIKNFSNNVSDLVTVTAPDQIEYNLADRLLIARNEAVQFLPAVGNWVVINSTNDGATFFNIYPQNTNSFTVLGQYNRGIVEVASGGTSKTITIPNNAIEPINKGYGTIIVNRDAAGSATLVMSGTDTLVGNPIVNPLSAVLLYKSTYGSGSRWVVIPYFVNLQTNGFLINSGGALSARSIVESDVTNLTTDLAAKVNLNGSTMTGALIASQVNPSTSNSAEFVTAGYVASIASGLSPAVSVYTATTSNLISTYNNGSSGIGATLTAVSLGAAIIDGVTLDSEDVGQLILFKNQTALLQNGIYLVTDPGSISASAVFTRSPAFDQTSELTEGKLFTVIFGNVQAGSQWFTTSINPVIGTNPITFSIFTPAPSIQAGAGLQLVGNILSMLNTSVTAGSYGSASKTLTSTVNSRGQETALNEVDIAITASQVTNFNAAAAAASPVQSVAGRTGIVTLTHTDITDFNASTDSRISAAIGVTVEAHSSELDALGALSSTGVMQRTGANTYSAGNIPESSVTNLVTDLAGKANVGGFNATGTWPISITGTSSGATTCTTVPALSGDITTTGTTNVTTLKNTGTAGTYTKVTTDSQGRVSSGTTLSASDIPTLTAAKISDFNTAVATTAVLKANNLSDLANPSTALANLGVLPVGSSSSLIGTLALTNPTQSGSYYKISFASTTPKIVLPQMNVTGSLWLGGYLVFENAYSVSFPIYYHDGTTLITTLKPGNKVVLYLTSTSSSNGTVEVWTSGTATNQDVSYFLQSANNLSDLSSPSSALVNLGVLQVVSVISITGTLVLDNSIATQNAQYFQITASASTPKVFLAPMNAVGSLQLGGSIFFENQSANSIPIYYQDGTTLLTTVKVGNRVELHLYSNTTANGNMIVWTEGTSANFDESHFSLSARNINAGGILSGGGDLTADRTITFNRYDIYANIITEATTARTLAIADVNSTILCNNATGNTTITLPTNASVAIPLGSMVRVSNTTVNNSFVTNVVASGGVTFKQMGANSTVGQGGYIILQKIATNTWEVLQIQEFYTTSGNTFTGPWASAQAAEYTLYRNNRQVTWDIPLAQVGTTSSTGAPITTSQNMPTRFTPAVLRNENMFVQSNASQNNGRCWFDVTGVITIYSTSSRNNFAATGSAIIISTGGMTWTM